MFTYKIPSLHEQDVRECYQAAYLDPYPGHLSVFPSTVLERRYHCGPLQQYLLNATRKTETAGHMLLHGPSMMILDIYLLHFVMDGKLLML